MATVQENNNTSTLEGFLPCNYTIIRVDNLVTGAHFLFGNFPNDKAAYKYVKDESCALFKHLKLPSKVEYRVQQTPVTVTIVEKDVKGWMRTGDVELFKLTTVNIINYRQAPMSYTPAKVMEPTKFSTELQNEIERRRAKQLGIPYEPKVVNPTKTIEPITAEVKAVEPITTTVESLTESKPSTIEEDAAQVLANFEACNCNEEKCEPRDPETDSDLPDLVTDTDSDSDSDSSSSSSDSSSDEEDDKQSITDNN